MVQHEKRPCADEENGAGEERTPDIIQQPAVRTKSKRIPPNVKHEVLRQLANGSTAQDAAQKAHVGTSTVYEWQKLGKIQRRAVRSRGKRVPPHVKIEALRQLASGSTAPDAAQEAGVKISTVNRWRNNLKEYGSVIRPRLKPLGRAPKITNDDGNALLEHMVNTSWMDKSQMRTWMSKVRGVTVSLPTIYKLKKDRRWTKDMIADMKRERSAREKSPTPKIGSIGATFDGGDSRASSNEITSETATFLPTLENVGFRPKTAQRGDGQLGSSPTSTRSFVDD